jgi:hypothetical protein
MQTVSIPIYSTVVRSISKFPYFGTCNVHQFLDADSKILPNAMGILRRKVYCMSEGGGAPGYPGFSVQASDCSGTFESLVLWVVDIICKHKETSHPTRRYSGR